MDLLGLEAEKVRLSLDWITEEQAGEGGNVSGSDVELAWLLALGLNDPHNRFLCVWRTGFLQGFQAIFPQLGYREVNELINLILRFYLTSHSSQLASTLGFSLPVSKQRSVTTSTQAF